MTHDQLVILLVLAATVGMFTWGRWRHDMVALGALLACVLTGVLPRTEAFAGFGHPAVITVACVLVLSHGLQTSGAVDALAQRLVPSSAGPTLTIAAITGLGTIISAFMNNVGALALLMPVAMQAAAKQNLTPGRVLMPLSFGTILGGMTTMIGTPPNLIVSGFRAETGQLSFGMFDFVPVGLAVAATGIIFVVLLGWRLVPVREHAGAETFDIGAYLTEARVMDDSKSVGKTLRETGRALQEVDAQITGLILNNFRVTRPNPEYVLRSGDILVIEAEPESLASSLSGLGLKLEEEVRGKSKTPDDQRAETDTNEATATEKDSPKKKQAGTGDSMLMELAVRPDALVINRSASDIRLRTRHGINLLALSRKGRRSISRLRSTAIQAGDVLLMQGSPEAIMGFAGEFGCVPLAQRPIHIPNKRRALIGAVILVAAIGGAAFGLLPAAISFAAGALACTAFRVIPARTIYQAIDWPVIVLLGALIPVAGVMASSGAADLIARTLLEHISSGSATISLAIILVVAMTLSDFMNNAATAAMMCPIAISTATQLEVRPDSFLMAVAVGASCALLTPIGHQNNTLIMGPGGFRFGDYWKLGLPLEILVAAVALPTLLLFWPF